MDLLMTYSMILTRDINLHGLINLFSLSPGSSCWVKYMPHIPGFQDDSITATSSVISSDYARYGGVRLKKKKKKKNALWKMRAKSRINRWVIIFTELHSGCLIFFVYLGVNMTHGNRGVTHIMYNAFKPPWTRRTEHGALKKITNGAQNSVKNIVFLLSSDLRK